jgi:hypothetical protein
MSPPPPDETRSYLEIIQQDYAQRAAEHDEVRRLRREIEVKKLQVELADLSSTVKPRRQSVEYYCEQLAVWFNNLPAAARQTPRSMEELLSLMKGRTPGMRPHAPEVAIALKSLLWTRKRCWHSDGEGRRFWHPPSAPVTRMSYIEKQPLLRKA